MHLSGTIFKVQIMCLKTVTSVWIVVYCDNSPPHAAIFIITYFSLYRQFTV